MFDLGIKTTVTFSFSKLNHALDEIIPEALQDSRTDIAQKWKDNIDGQDFKPLTKFTRKRRSDSIKGIDEYNSFYPNIPPIDTTTILKATGKLYDSIKPTDKGIQFNAYGDWHVKGSIRPKRNWMTLKGLGKAERLFSDKNLRKLQEDIKKSFKIPKKNIREMKF